MYSDCSGVSVIFATAYLDSYAENYVTGNNTLDIDTNGCDVNTDPSFPSLKFSIDGDSRIYHSNYSGTYTLGLQDGLHTITPEVTNPDYFTISPTSLTVDFPSDTSPFMQDFCMTPNGTHNDLEVTLHSNNVIPGFNSNVYILYKNVGNTILSGNIDFNYNDDFMDFVSANPMEASQTTGNLTFNFTDLAPFERRYVQVITNLNTPTDATFPLNLGDILTYSATVNPITYDETPDNNTRTLNATVVNSYDPNDITCLEGKEIEVSEVGAYVHYKIRFENNGTANATHVRVHNVIDLAKLDISTLIPVDGSHDFVTDIKNSNEVDFIFENINLPFNDEDNDGYVIYKIKTLSSLVVGDTFNNQAAIYFDFNAPINTNTESTTIIENELSVANVVKGDAIHIYPNPVSDVLFIDTIDGDLKQIEIYSISGKRIQSYPLANASGPNKIDVSFLNNGLYFVKIYTDKTPVIKKIMKF